MKGSMNRSLAIMSMMFQRQISVLSNAQFLGKMPGIKWKPQIKAYDKRISKYMPHQGPHECARRVRQMEKKNDNV